MQPRGRRGDGSVTHRKNGLVIGYIRGLRTLRPMDVWR